MAAAVMPPIDAVLLRYRLQLLYSPIQRIAVHGFEQFHGLVHMKNSITRNIICQWLFAFADANEPKFLGLNVASTVARRHVGDALATKAQKKHASGTQWPCHRLRSVRGSL